MSEAVALGWRQFRLERKQFWRNPTAAFFGFMLPMRLPADHRLADAGDAIATSSSPGIAGMNVMASTFNAIAMNMTFRREQGLLKRARGTPMPTGSYLGGIFGNVALNGSIQVALVVVRRALLFGLPMAHHWDELIDLHGRRDLLVHRAGHRVLAPDPELRRRAGLHELRVPAVDPARRRVLRSGDHLVGRARRHRARAADQPLHRRHARRDPAGRRALPPRRRPDGARAVGRSRACGSRSAGSAGSSGGADDPRRRRLALDRPTSNGAPGPLLAQEPEDVDVVVQSPWRCHARSTPSWRKPSAPARASSARCAGSNTRRRARGRRPRTRGGGSAPWTRRSRRCPSAGGPARSRPSRAGRGATARPAPSRRRRRARRRRSRSPAARPARARLQARRCRRAARPRTCRAPTRTSGSPRDRTPARRAPQRRRVGVAQRECVAGDRIVGMIPADGDRTALRRPRQPARARGGPRRRARPPVDALGARRRLRELRRLAGRGRRAHGRLDDAVWIRGNWDRWQRGERETCCPARTCAALARSSRALGPELVARLAELPETAPRRRHPLLPRRAE